MQGKAVEGVKLILKGTSSGSSQDSDYVAVYNELKICLDHARIVPKPDAMQRREAFAMVGINAPSIMTCYARNIWL